MEHPIREYLREWLLGLLEKAESLPYMIFRYANNPYREDAACLSVAQEAADRIERGGDVALFKAVYEFARAELFLTDWRFDYPRPLRFLCAVEGSNIEDEIIRMVYAVEEKDEILARQLAFNLLYIDADIVDGKLVLTKAL